VIRSNQLLALLLLLILTPLLIPILLITFFDLKCNPVFVQPRTVNGLKIFDFYKIRTMRKDAPLVDTNSFKNPEIYITKWGQFLRLYSIDELLNLISIVEGNMSFIGPRPIMTSETEMIRVRQLYKIDSLGGLTGFAQINGRDMITIGRKIAAERYFEMRKSRALKLYILMVTIKIVFKKSGITH
jgi:O-antigen biosynthesis protein WbqP